MSVDAVADQESSGSSRTADPATRSTRFGPRVRTALRDVLLLGGAAGYVVLLLLSRQSGQFDVTNTIWAEDGRIFISDAYDDASPAGWFRIYTGYLHVVPRALASVIVALPADQAAWWIAVLTSVLAAVCLLLLAAGLRPWLPETWMQAALVVSVGSAPVYAGEVGANLANWHWFASLALIGLVLIRPRSWWISGVAAVTALLFALSDALVPAFAVLAVLVLAWRFHRRTDDVLKTVPVAVAVGVGAVWQQAASLVKDRGGPAFPPVGSDEMVDLYVNDVLARRVTLLDLDTWMVVGQALLVLALVAIAVVADLRRDGAAGRGAVLRRLGVAGAFVAASPLFMFVSVYVNHNYAERYAAVPAGLLVTGVVVAVAGTGVVHRVLVGVVTVAMVGSVLYAGQVSYPNRSIGPDHGVEVDRARELCEDGREIVRVPTAPSTGVAPDNEGVWFVMLRCADVVDD
jgi:hypothetical protein